MKQYILSLIGLFLVNFVNSQDVSPCSGLEMYFSQNFITVFSIELNTDELNYECGIPLWQPANSSSPYYIVYPPDTTTSYSLCAELEVDYMDGFVCEVCNEVFWMDGEWVLDLPNWVKPIKVTTDMENIYYSTGGTVFNSFYDIPLGQMYILNGKKYIKNNE
jgi:hypothetical protein